MRFSIDVLFLDAAGVVLWCETLRPWHFSRWVRKATGVLELPAGTLARTQTARGDQILLKDVI